MQLFQMFRCPHRYSVQDHLWNTKTDYIVDSLFLIAGLHEGGAASGERQAVSGKRHRECRRRGVYKSGTTVCAAVYAAQMGVNFCQSSGTVPL